VKKIIWDKTAKKTQKTPRRDIAIAEKRLRRLINDIK